MVSSVNFKEELKQRKAEAEAVIRSFLPEEENRDGRLAEAVNYSILAGGKRLRPILLREMYRKLGGKRRWRNRSWLRSR